MFCLFCENGDCDGLLCDLCVVGVYVVADVLALEFVCGGGGCSDSVEWVEDDVFGLCGEEDAVFDELWWEWCGVLVLFLWGDVPDFGDVAGV